LKLHYMHLDQHVNELPLSSNEMYWMSILQKKDKGPLADAENEDLRAKVQKVHLFLLSSVPALATVQGTSEHICRHVIGMLPIKL
jgi:hypothetical protein